MIKIIRERENVVNKTTIQSHLFASGVDIECVVTNSDGNNSSALFELKIEEGGQVEKGGHIKMYGPSEREELKNFLKTILAEIELLDKN